MSRISHLVLLVSLVTTSNGGTQGGEAVDGHRRNETLAEDTPIKVECDVSILIAAGIILVACVAVIIHVVIGLRKRPSWGRRIVPTCVPTPLPTTPSLSTTENSFFVATVSAPQSMLNVNEYNLYRNHPHSISMYGSVDYNLQNSFNTACRRIDVPLQQLRGPMVCGCVVAPSMGEHSQRQRVIQSNHVNAFETGYAIGEYDNTEALMHSSSTRFGSRHELPHLYCTPPPKPPRALVATGSARALDDMYAKPFKNKQPVARHTDTELDAIFVHHHETSPPRTGGPAEFEMIENMLYEVASTRL